MEYYETFDSGSSLAALGYYDVQDAANQAAAGRNASYGFSNVPATQGEALLPLRPTNPRMCLTFDFQRDAGTYVTYFIAQYAGYHNVSAQSIGDVQVGFDANGTTLTIDTSVDGTIDTVANFWPATGSAWYTCRIELQASTYNASAVMSNNGICRIWLTSETGELTLRYDRTDLRIPDFRQEFADPMAMPWSGLLFTALGAFDNIYCTDYLCSMQPAPPGGTCCGSSGPGGTDPDRPPDDPTTSPRIIPPGGYPPSYTACTGGGTPATASDPSDPQSLTDAVQPLVHVQLSLPDSTVLRYGQQAFTSGNGSAVTARVLEWAPVSQTLADIYGSFEAMRTTIRLDDTDGVIRGHLAHATNRNIDGREATLWIETAANAALSVNPRSLSRGVVTNWRTTTGLDVEIEITDPLGYRYSSVSLDRPIPQRTFRKELFPTCPEGIVGQPIPIIYGEYSDDYTWSVDAARIPAGITPVYYVGRATDIPSLSGLPENHWYAFVVCGHAIAGVQSWFGSNTHPGGPASVRMEPGTAGVDFLIPNYTGWSARFATNYIDITGTDGVTERFTMVFARGPRGDHAVGIDANVPLTLNICGLEDVGDCSGEVITDMAYQLQHFISYFVLQNYRTGSWGAVPTFPSGVAKVRTSSFDTVRAFHDVRITDGYQGAIYIGTQQPAREHLSFMQIGMDIRLGVNHHGQIIAHTFDSNATTSGLTTFTSSSHTEESQFDVDPRLDEVVNVVSSEYGFEAATGFVAGTQLTLRDAASITAHGERIANDLEPLPTRISFVAWDITARMLLRGRNAVALVSFKVDLRGLALSIGNLVRLTDFRGIGSTGYSNRIVMVTRITTDPNVGELLCTIEGEDVHEMLPGTALQLDTGLIDVATIG